jgi:sulfur carrier protein
MGAVHAPAVHRNGPVTVSVQVKLNGEPRELPDGAALAEAVTQVTDLASGVAAAVNGDVVPRGSWAATPLRDGDQVEVVTAVQGG